MFLTKENEKKAYDAMQKMQALDAAGKWDELTEEVLFWSLIHCVYEHMNSDHILKRPTVKLPWSLDEWKAEVRAKSIKAFNMFLGYMPPEVRERFSQSKTVSADHVFHYLRETWESRDYYSDWHRRWKWRWDYGNPMPTYEERVEYVYAMMELLEKRKKREQRRLAKKKAEEVRETKAKVKGKGEGKAKGKGKVPEPKRSNISSALPGPPPPPSAMSQPLEVAVANERPMEVSPSPQDPLTAPPVMVAEKMLSELQL